MSDKSDGVDTNPAEEHASSTRTVLTESSWRRRLAFVATLGAAVVALAAVAGIAGKAWWLFDLASHFRVQYFWGLSLGMGLLLVARRRRTALLVAGLLVLHGWLLRPFFTPGSRAPNEIPGVRVMTLNVWGRNHEYERVIEFIQQSSPDIIVLEEIDERWGAPLDALKARWPHRRVKEGVFSIAILSRLPLDESRIEFLSDGVPVITARVTVNETPIFVCGVHLVRPMSHAGTMHQARQLTELADLLEGESTRKVILGDFNSTSWSSAFSDFVSRAGLHDTRLGFGVQPTWPSFLPSVLRIPIDHCLVSGGVQAARREIGPDVGSDHLPVIVDLIVPAEKGQNDENSAMR